VSEQAFERALEALSQHERTSGELCEWLAERGFERAEIEAAVERLIEAGAVDDERFALRFAADKRELRGWGPDRIREALSGRRVSRDLIDAALADEEPSAQLERAIALLERRPELPADAPSRARAVAYLARRGYDSEIAHDAVRGVERRAA
jgi:regulatory protein